MRDSGEEKRPADRGAGRRGGITRVRKGVWRIRWSRGRDPNTGKRIRGKQTIRGTKARAERALTEALRRVDAGAASRSSRMTLGQWLDEWLRTWCKQVTERTRHTYRGVIDAYVPAGLSRRRLTAVETADLQTLFNAMTDRDPPLSPRTVRMTRAVLRAALGRAVKIGRIERNVATLVDLPALIKKERKVFTPQEARQFIKAAEADRWHALWVLLVTTGLRPGTPPDATNLVKKHFKPLLEAAGLPMLRLYRSPPHRRHADAHERGASEGRVGEARPCVDHAHDGYVFSCHPGHAEGLRGPA